MKAAQSESEGESQKKTVVTRKQTRSSSARRSKHLIGKASDTDSETGILLFTIIMKSFIYLYIEWNTV